MKQRHNQSFDRTHTGGEDLRTHRASSAPLFAAYLLRYASCQKYAM